MQSKIRMIGCTYSSQPFNGITAQIDLMVDPGGLDELRALILSFQNGERFVLVNNSRRCAYCGTEPRGGDKSCHKCGAPLG